MGLFKKDIGDIKDNLEQGNYEDAIRILDSHIENEHNIESDLNELRRVSSSYEQLLLMVKKYLHNRGNYKDEKLVNLDLMLDYLEKAQEMVEQLEDIIERLEKGGKLAK